MPRQGTSIAKLATERRNQLLGSATGHQARRLNRAYNCLARNRRQQKGRALRGSALTLNLYGLVRRGYATCSVLTAILPER